MKTVTFMRHGKSSWEDRLSDQDRPLNPRGVGDAHLVGAYMQKYGPSYEAVYSSPAIRALHTCAIYTKEIRVPRERIVIREEIYDFGGDAVLGFIKQLPNTINDIMVFGHNHAFTHLVNSLGSAHLENLPTAGLVKVKFEEEHWRKIGKGETEKIVLPKILKRT